MKWQGRRESDNVKDNRGMSRGSKGLIGGGVVGVIILLVTLFGGEQGRQLVPILEGLTGTEQTGEPVKARDLSEEEINMGKMVRVIFADTEDIWHQVLKENGFTYREPQMELFDDQVQTGCGGATAAVGPFYCPADETVYIDLRFFEELYNRFGAERGNFAIAYVIAHEVGHHVQNILGTSHQISQLQRSGNQKDANKLSVALELQADFYAGVWAKYNQKYLESNDIEVAISAANAVGDDAIQKKVQGQVNPDSFTHGTSKQRIASFMKGYETGDIKQGDIFK